MIFRATLLILFAASLLYILFLANGLQYDFFSNQIRKTGIIDITYADPQAKVYLDGVKLPGRLPFVASNVLPGEYNLVIGREGYWDYALKVSVYEDLISKVNTVFLYPIDVLGQSMFVLDFFDGDKNKLFLRDGYIFYHQKNGLSWSRLNPDISLGAFLKTSVLAIPIKNIDIVDREAVIEYIDGQKQLVDIFSGQVQRLNILDKYTFAGKQWLYHDGNLLAAFDRKLSRVLWAKYLEEDLVINSVSHFSLKGRDFISISLAGNKDSGRLYEIKGDQLELIINDEIANLTLDDKGNLYYTLHGTELWKWQPKAAKPSLMVRLQSKIEDIFSLANFHQTNGVLIVKTAGQFMIVDEKFDNVQEMFSDLEVSQITTLPGGQVYFLNHFDNGQQLKIRLLLLDLNK